MPASSARRRVSTPAPIPRLRSFVSTPLGLAVLLAALLAMLPTTARAETCRLDAVPAATVLLPYFEVDLEADPGQGVSTFMTLHNALPEPALGHVTVWSDWGVPVLDFDLYLTGFDRETIDFYDMIVNGNLPITADLQSDPGDTISPGGPFPEWEGSFQNCDLFFPFFVNPLLTGTRLENLQARLTGGCDNLAIQSSSNQGDGIARGFATVDAVGECSIDFPSDQSYFTDGVSDGVAIDNNQFWGDWTIHEPAAGRRISAPLVHIEADENLEPGATATGYTFYGRFTQGFGTFDRREPLASVWGGKYFVDSIGETDWIVWRDSTVSDAQGLACGSEPDWIPLQEAELRCFDFQESTTLLCQGEGDPACFPRMTQRIAFGEGEVNPPWSSGWCLLDLSAPDSGTGDVDFNGDVQQGFVLPVISLPMGEPGMAQAAALRDACQVAAAPRGGPRS